jgi:hypothetical protein
VKRRIRAAALENVIVGLIGMLTPMELEAQRVPP